MSEALSFLTFQVLPFVNSSSGDYYEVWFSWVHFKTLSILLLNHSVQRLYCSCKSSNTSSVIPHVLAVFCKHMIASACRWSLGDIIATDSGWNDITLIFKENSWVNTFQYTFWAAHLLLRFQLHQTRNTIVAPAFGPSIQWLRWLIGPSSSIFIASSSKTVGFFFFPIVRSSVYGPDLV